MTISNTLILGDCIEAMANLEPTSVDFVLTDPPYLIGLSRARRQERDQRQYTRWLRPAFRKSIAH